MPTHNKLVRDRIPEIIAKSGKKYSTKILDNSEYEKELKKKIFEELDEYMNADDNTNAVEEMADVLEIFCALAECHGTTIVEVEEVRKKKAEKRGGFKEKIFLIEVEDE